MVHAVFVSVSVPRLHDSWRMTASGQVDNYDAGQGSPTSLGCRYIPSPLRIHRRSTRVYLLRAFMHDLCRSLDDIILQRKTMTHDGWQDVDPCRRYTGVLLALGHAPDPGCIHIQTMPCDDAPTLELLPMEGGVPLAVRYWVYMCIVRIRM